MAGDIHTAGTNLPIGPADPELPRIGKRFIGRQECNGADGFSETVVDHNIPTRIQPFKICICRQARTGNHLARLGDGEPSTFCLQRFQADRLVGLSIGSGQPLPVVVHIDDLIDREAIEDDIGSVSDNQVLPTCCSSKTNYVLASSLVLEKCRGKPAIRIRLVMQYPPGRYEIG